MDPIPADASTTMLFSVLIAMVLTSWLVVKLHSVTGRHPRRTSGLEGQGFG
jgi:hypothetical protein